MGDLKLPDGELWAASGSGLELCEPDGGTRGDAESGNGERPPVESDGEAPSSTFDGVPVAFSGEDGVAVASPSAGGGI